MSTQFLDWITLENLDKQEFPDNWECHIDYISSMIQWLEVFINRPHHDLGRKGVICPCMPTILGKLRHSLYITLIFEKSEKFLFEQLNYCAKVFLQDLLPLDGPHKLYKSILIGIVGISHEKVNSFYIKNREHFVQQGVVLGAFNQNSVWKGVHNRNFTPFSGPHPFFTLRYIIPEDIIFHLHEDFFQKCYLKNFNIQNSAELLSFLKKYKVDKLAPQKYSLLSNEIEKLFDQ